MTLADLKIGESASVVRLNDAGAVRRHIMDMGLTKGVSVTMVKVAPFGDPLQVRVRDYYLTLRKEDAQMVEVMATANPAAQGSQAAEVA